MNHTIQELSPDEAIRLIDLFGTSETLPIVSGHALDMTQLDTAIAEVRDCATCGLVGRRFFLMRNDTLKNYKEVGIYLYDNKNRVRLTPRLSLGENPGPELVCEDCRTIEGIFHKQQTLTNQYRQSPQYRSSRGYNWGRSSSTTSSASSSHNSSTRAGRTSSSTPPAQKPIGFRDTHSPVQVNTSTLPPSMTAPLYKVSYIEAMAIIEKGGWARPCGLSTNQWLKKGETGMFCLYQNNKVVRMFKHPRIKWQKQTWETA